MISTDVRTAVFDATSNRKSLLRQDFLSARGDEENEVEDVEDVDAVVDEYCPEFERIANVS
jgi:hypothetical protein